jgi:anti-sigma factor RsiW
MNDADFNELWDRAVRARLTPDEQARFQAILADDAALRAQWEEELALNRMLAQLPDAPVPTNFTARVLRAVQAGAPARPSRFRWVAPLFPPARPGLAAAAGVVLAVGLGVFVYQQRQAVLRARLAESVSTVSTIAALPSVEVLRDFEAIRRLDRTPVEADTDLLAALE